MFLTIFVLKINSKISISFMLYFYTTAFWFGVPALDNLHFTWNWHFQTTKYKEMKLQVRGKAKDEGRMRKWKEKFILFFKYC